MFPRIMGIISVVMVAVFYFTDNLNGIVVAGFFLIYWTLQEIRNEL